MSVNLNPSTKAPVKKSRSNTTKSYFLPMLWHRHTEVSLCSHEHKTLESAKECLDSKKRNFDVILEDPNLSKRLKNYYQNATFSIREVVIKRSWALHSQIDHYADGSSKEHWQNRFADLEHLPIFGFCSDSLSIFELVNIINNYHDQPKKKSKHRAKPLRVINLGDYISYNHPTYLVALTRGVQQVASNP